MHYIKQYRDTPQSLSQAVIQVTELLGLYRAETARVLHVHCEDIGELFDGKRLLIPGSVAWYKAIQFVEFYNSLFESMQGNSVSMCHWLRATHTQLGTTPLLAMVDQDQIDKVIELLTDCPC